MINPRPRFFLFFALLLFAKLSFSQNREIDSLKQVLKTAQEDTNKVNSLYRLGLNFFRMGRFDTAIALQGEAVRLAEKISHKIGAARSYKVIGNIYNAQGDYPKALENYFLGLAIYKELKNDWGVGSSYTNMGLAYERQGNHVEALKRLFAALQIMEAHGAKWDIAAAHYNIGNVYYDQSKYNEALHHYSTALKMMEESGDKRNIATAHIGLGNVYIAMNKDADALKQFNSALVYTKEVGDLQSEAGLYNNIAQIYSNQKNYSKALLQLFSALKLSQEIDDRLGVAAEYGNIGMVYLGLKNAAEGRMWLQKGLDLSKEIGSKGQIKNAYKTLAEADSMLGDYKTAYYHVKMYCMYKDSIINEDASKQIAEMQTKYQTELKETEIKNLKQQEEIRLLELAQKNAQLKERNLIIMFVLVIFFMLVLSGILLFRYQHIKNTQKINQVEENERRRMAKDIHDDLGSGLSKIKFVSEKLAAKSGNNPELLSGIDTIADTSMRLVENMHDLIWAMNPENTTLDSLVARIREYGSDYLNDTGQTLSIRIPDNIPAEKINQEAHRNIFFIAKEALQNVVKHAQATQVEIALNFDNNYFSLRISDNGKGIAEENKQGNGLLNMKQRAAAIGASFKLSSTEKGTEITLEVALSKLAKTA